MSDINRAAAKFFTDAANALETGVAVNRARIAVTGLGGEFGEKPIAEACAAAVLKGFCVHYLGTETVPGAVNITCTDEDQCHAEMARLLKSGECAAAVTMHHNFPLGTATVGRVITPSRGKEMFIATTTGTPSSDRTLSLVLGAIYGLAAAKSCGVENPTVGLLNIDGARRAASALRKLRDGGFPIEFAESARSDGGAILRGNDVLLGTADVLVCDPLTGNVLVKMLSAYTSGGSRECAGYGYGPGIGRDAAPPVLIVSRAADAPVILNAIRYAAEVVGGGITKIASSLLALADHCGLSTVIDTPREVAPDFEPLAREPVTEEIPGIEVTDIEDAALFLQKSGIYAEGGMGCTGPVIMVNEKNFTRAEEFLREARYID